MSCHSGRSAEKEREEGREKQKRNKDGTEERSRGRDEGRGLRKVGKFKGEDMCRLESSRLVKERLSVKSTSSPVLPNLKIILQLMRRTIK